MDAIQSAPQQLAPFLMAVAAIVLVCQLAGTLAARLGQPAVVGEMVGGLLLGPCLLGAMPPGLRSLVFPESVQQGVDTAAQLGLVVFMFLLGTELAAAEAQQVRRRTVLLVGLGSTVPSVLGGLVLALVLGPMLEGDGGHPAASVLFVALALSVTAVPVLGRVLHDYGLAGTRLGLLAVTTSAIGDAATWAGLTLLLVATGVAGGGTAVVLLALGAGMPVLLWGVVRPALRRFSRWSVGSPVRERLLVAVVLAGAIAAAAGTQYLGLHPAIGAFLFGTVVPRGSHWAERTHRQMEGFTKTLLMPLFFASVGVQMSLGSLGGTASGGLALLVILTVAFASKLVGVFGGARLAGVPRPEALSLATLMNCRGVTDLVVISVGWQCHLISRFGFTALVVVAMATTVATGPLLNAARRLGLQPTFGLLGQGRAGAARTDPRTRTRTRTDPSEPLRERLDALDETIIGLVEARSELARELVRTSDGEDSGESLARACQLLYRYHEALGRPGTDVATALIGLDSELLRAVPTAWEPDSAGTAGSW